MNDGSEAIEAVQTGLHEAPRMTLDDAENLYRPWLDARQVHQALFDKYGLGNQ